MHTQPRISKSTNSLMPLTHIHTGHNETVAFIVAEIKRLAPASGDIDERTDITTGVNLDSVAIMDLVFAVEEKFDLSISMNDLADITTIRQLADLVGVRAAA